MATTETDIARGVSFALSDEQAGLRALAREFAEKEIRPVAQLSRGATVRFRPFFL